MLKLTTSGVLYIIGEHSHNGTPTDMYKVGIVRDNDRSRSVDERLREHQTGNPRELFIAHTEQTPLVERIETLIHGQHATQRVGGEWFHLPGTGLNNLIATAATHIAAANTVTPILHQANDLAATPSNGQTIPASSEHLALHNHYINVRAQLSACQTAINHLITQLLTRQHTEQPRRPWVHVDVKAARRTIDKKAFEAAHPDLYQQYVTEKESFTKAFRPSTKGTATPLEAANPTLAEITTTATNSHADTHDGDTLHRIYLAVLEQQAPLLWAQDQIDTTMRVACADNDAISDICTWKRSTVTRPELDTDALKTEHPDLFEQFVQTGEPTTAHIATKDLNYRQ